MKAPIAEPRLPIKGDLIYIFDKDHFRPCDVIKVVNQEPGISAQVNVINHFSVQKELFQLKLSEWKTNEKGNKGNWYIPDQASWAPSSIAQHNRTRSDYGMKRYVDKVIDSDDERFFEMKKVKIKIPIESPDVPVAGPSSEPAKKTRPRHKVTANKNPGDDADVDEPGDEKPTKIAKTLKTTVTFQPDYKGLLDKITNLEHENIMVKARLEMLEEKAKSNNNDQTVLQGMPPTPGVLTLRDIKMFQDMSPAIKALYADDNRTDSRVIMCANYKSMTSSCATVDSKGKKTSPPAKFVHMNIFGYPEYRNISSNEIIPIVKKHALCTACKNANDGVFVNVSDGANICMLCKQGGTYPKGVGIICGECNQAVEVKGSGTEKCLDHTLSILRDVFYDIKDFNIGINRYVSVNESGNGSTSRQIDCYVSGKIKGFTFHIIVEKDEGQHMSSQYTPAQETKKLFSQTRAVVGTGPMANNRIFMIRYSPEGVYLAEDGTIQNYEQHERLVILRQWIIWWLMNIENMRTCSLMYMWYHSNRRAQLTCPKWDGMAMIYDRPKPPSVADWAYAVNYQEIKSPSPYYKVINEKSVDPDALEGFKWRKRDEIQELPTNF